MFTGLNASTTHDRVRDYPTAVAAYEAAQRTPTGRQRQPDCDGTFPLSTNLRGPRRVSTSGDAIAFRLYDTDVVTWHPDGSVEVENYGSVTTGQFANTYLPNMFSLSHSTSMGGHEGIYYPATGDGDWRDRMVCRGSVVHFLPNTEGGFTPDPDTCSSFPLPVTVADRKARMAIAKEYNLRDFTAWLQMAPKHLNLVHGGYDFDDCCIALRARDFATAASCLPTVSTTSFGRQYRRGPVEGALGIECHRDEAVTLTSVSKLKLALWDDAGLEKSEQVITVSAAEYEKRMTRGRQLDKLAGSYSPSYGLSA